MNEQYHIVIIKRRQLLLSLAKIRVVLDGKDIYPLENNQKVVIHVNHNNPVLVVTDGFHISRPLELVYHHLHTYYFRVECGMDDMQLVSGLLLTMFLVFLGSYLHILALKLSSALPICYVLFLYYMNRKDFLSLRAT